MELSFKKILLHLGLFIITFITTTLAGAEWVNSKSIFYSDGFSWNDFAGGMYYSVPFLLILSAHEFGHYFTAIHNKVRTTLPYYIPLPPLALMLGTLGALIRIKSFIQTKQKNFDIGIAGPLAGFFVSIIIIWYGFATLPPPEYIFQFHPDYKQFGLSYPDFVYTSQYLQNGTVDIVMGKNLLFLFFEKFVGDPSRIPNPHELMHYPFLFAGFISLVFTSINLIPVGQLDGGHVLYGLIGYKKHRIVASVVYLLFLFYSGLGYIQFFGPTADPLWMIPLYLVFLYSCIQGLKLPPKDTAMYAMLVFTVQFLMFYISPSLHGYSGWLLFVFIIGRFIGIPHPPSPIEAPLTKGRVILGWIALIIFVICFTPTPIIMNVIAPLEP